MRPLTILFIFLLLAVFISGCTQPSEGGNTTISDLAKASCIGFCQDAFNRGQDLSNGPCLSDTHEDWNITDWVCDIAHSPRQAADNDPANQCQEYREGGANHFVEVDPDCNFIKAV